MAKRKLDTPPETSHNLLQYEQGTIRKSHIGRLTIALVYPNIYSVGMSNLAIHTLYRLFNARDELVCERFFYDQSESGMPCSLESGKRLAEFDIIACSLSFELDYLNLIRLFHRAQIPLLQKERGEQYPLIIAGGIAISANPEPLADILDAVVLGEAEELIELLLDSWLRSNDIPRVPGKKTGILHQLSQVSGIYVPNIMDSAEHLPRLQVADLNRYPTVSQILTPNTEFKNMFLIELGRGCPYRCRFCLAGCFYAPVRYRSLEHLRTQIEQSRQFTDGKTYPRIGIVATAIADYPQIKEFCAEMLDKKIAVSFASLRADKAPDSLLQLLKQSGQKTVTFAPEAGSESLRNYIGKPITESALLNLVERSVSIGLLNIKLYFMIGLPHETEADIVALISLSKKLRDTLLVASKPYGRAGKLIIAITPFIPKKGTVFENEPMASRWELNKKSKLIREHLRKEPNLQFQIAQPKAAELEAMISLGERELGRRLIALVFDSF
ncbi:MAG: radical SAM protein [bacterium]